MVLLQQHHLLGLYKTISLIFLHPLTFTIGFNFLFHFFIKIRGSDSIMNFLICFYLCQYILLCRSFVPFYKHIYSEQVAGSNPAHATEEKSQFLDERLGFFYCVYECSLMYSICRFGARFRHTTLLPVFIFWISFKYLLISFHSSSAVESFQEQFLLYLRRN